MKCSCFTPSAAPSLPWGRLGVVVPSLRRVVVPTLRYNWDYLMAGAYWLKLSILDLTQVGFGTKASESTLQKYPGIDPINSAKLSTQVTKSLGVVAERLGDARRK